MGNLIFNGVSTVDMGVKIQTPPIYEFPKKMYDIIHIKGRNGDLSIDQNSYYNVQRKYYLALGFKKNSSFITNAKMLMDWLLTVNGYSRLEDSYEPDYYRLALFEDPGEMNNYQDEATTLEVAFNCKPQRYLKTGDLYKKINELNTYVKIVNPTKYTSLPEIKLDGDDIKIDFYSGDNYTSPKNSSSLLSSYNQEFLIDSELQDCYSNTEYVNNKITLTNGFPKLYSGSNWIKITGTNLRKFEIKPRWWTL